MLNRTFDSKEDEIKERCEGVLFSLLAMLDGSSLNLPSFAVVAAPHQDDMEYQSNNGENWFPPLPEEVADQLVDISGGLHEILRKYV